MRWRNTRKYRVWRAKVIRRDKVCVICGSRKGREAHHLDSAAYFPDKRFDLDNGVCACHTCHQHMFHHLFKGGTRKKATKEDFKRFKWLLDVAHTRFLSVRFGR